MLFRGAAGRDHGGRPIGHGSGARGARVAPRADAVDGLRHLDRQPEARVFAGTDGLPVAFVDSHPCYWGGFGMVAAALKGIRLLMREGAEKLGIFHEAERKETAEAAARAASGPRIVTISESRKE